MDYEDGVGTKMLRRAFCSRGSGVRGWGSEVRGPKGGHKLIKPRKKLKKKTDFDI